MKKKKSGKRIFAIVLLVVIGIEIGRASCRERV